MHTNQVLRFISGNLQLSSSRYILAAPCICKLYADRRRSVSFERSYWPHIIACIIYISGTADRRHLCTTTRRPCQLRVGRLDINTRSTAYTRHTFLSRVSILTRDIDIVNLSVCLSVRLSVRNVPVSDENGLTYRHSFSHHTVAQSF